jgi:hypothetical protein
MKLAVPRAIARALRATRAAREVRRRVVDDLVGEHDAVGVGCACLIELR